MCLLLFEIGVPDLRCKNIFESRLYSGWYLFRAPRHFYMGFPPPVLLVNPNKDETAVYGCHYPGDMAVRMRKVLQTAGLVFEYVLCFFVC